MIGGKWPITNRYRMTGCHVTSSFATRGRCCSSGCKKLTGALQPDGRRCTFSVVQLEADQGEETWDLSHGSWLD